jgi:hypothetical protein
MKLRFQAYNDLAHRIVIATRRLEPAIDFQPASVLGLHLRVPDDRVLALAAEQGRVLASHDRKTMPEHFARFIATHISPGLIIVSRKLPVGNAAEIDALCAYVWSRHPCYALIDNAD